MTQPDSGPGADHPMGSNELGPAVPARGGADSPLPALEGALGPFVGGRSRTPEPTPEHRAEPAVHGWDDVVGGGVPSPAPDESDELPPEADSGEDEESEQQPDWLLRPDQPVAAFWGDVGGDSEVATEEMPWEDAVSEIDREEDTAHPLPDDEDALPSEEVLEEIADRLERIARALRSRDGDDFAGDAGDPLEVLITGYALGYSEGARGRRGGR